MPWPAISRRRFLTSSTVLTGGLMVPYISTANAEDADKPASKNDRFGIGSIGLRYQGSVITQKSLPYGDVVAVCDVDKNVGEQAMHSFAATALYEDYRKLLERKDIDVVMIGTPDHWHTKIVIDACRAGKDVYCEKPLTLTIDEGKLLCQVVKETGRIVQVGTWQRSDSRFRLAAEMVRQGRLGKLQKVHLACHSNPTGGPFKPETPPPNLNWDLWQGQTPNVPYIKERCHYTFRWWYEYCGGAMTDWGAHIVDIVHWAMGCQNSGPIEIDGRADPLPSDPNSYNVPPNFKATMRYADGVEVFFDDKGRGGILFEGDKGRIFVNRGTIAGKPFEELADSPLPAEQYALYPHDNRSRPPRAGKLDAIINHMGNFFDCVKSRNQPISDVVSQHRTVSACHLGNISIRLKRKLTWDPDKELFVGDDEANGWLRREQRKGFEIVA